MSVNEGCRPASRLQCLTKPPKLFRSLSRLSLWEEGGAEGKLVMPPITVNWSDLEIAFERNSPDQESFLDLENGDLMSIVDGEPDAAARRAKVAANPERYLRIDPASSREQYRWMERFVGSVADLPLRERLIIAIDGKGAFRRFKDVLLAFPAERERWFAYRSEVLHFHIQTWLEHMKVEVANTPPWGRVDAPSEPVEVPHPTVPGEAPGEMLRRQGREMLDEIPAAELPSALAFLEFLRDRGGSPLLRGAASVAKQDLPSPDHLGGADEDDDEEDDDPAAGTHEPAVALR